MWSRKYICDPVLFVMKILYEVKFVYKISNAGHILQRDEMNLKHGVEKTN